MTKEVSGATFNEEVIQAEQTVLVDFYAPWCAPCKSLLVHLEALTEVAPQFKIVKVNIDDESALARERGIRSVPTLMVFRGGKLVASKTGGMTAGQLNAFAASLPV